MGADQAKLAKLEADLQQMRDDLKSLEPIGAKLDVVIQHTKVISDATTQMSVHLVTVNDGLAKVQEPLKQLTELKKKMPAMPKNPFF